jgi:tetratricopeptide (TPR) repeat protein
MGGRNCATLLKESIARIMKLSRTGLAGILVFSLVGSQSAAQQDPLEQIRELRRLQESGTSPQLLIRLALAYYDARQYRLFEMTMKEATAATPASGAPHYYLGRYYLTVEDDVQKAAASFGEALARNAGDYRSLYFLGYCDELKRRPGIAEQRYQQAVKIAETQQQPFGLVYEGLARLRLQAGEPEAALPLARKAAATGPNDASSHRVLARCLTQLKQFQSAAQAWATAARLDPTDAPTLYSLYRAHRSAGDPVLAEQALEQFKRISAAYSRY